MVSDCWLYHMIKFEYTVKMYYRLGSLYSAHQLLRHVKMVEIVHCQFHLWHLVYSISIPMQYIYILWPWSMLFRRLKNWVFTYLRCLVTLSLCLLRQRNTEHLTTIVFQWESICGHMSYGPDISPFIYRLFMDNELDNIRNYVRSLFQLSALCQWSEVKCCFNLLLVQCSLNFGASNSVDTVCELLDLDSLSPCI